MKEMTSRMVKIYFYYTYELTPRIMDCMKILLLLFVMCSSVVWTHHQVPLLGDCSSDGCDIGMVCESNICKVKADGNATDCSFADSNCPTNAVCNNNTRSCNPGTREDYGLCTMVQGALCSTNNDCTGPGASYQCMAISPCSQGQCTCAAGYLNWNCQTLDHNMPCDVNDDKCDVGRGLACDNTTLRCACSDTNAVYKAAVGMCTAAKLFGETCAVTADCLTDATANGLCDPTTLTCGCAAGFVQHTSAYLDHECRQPQVGEMCSSTCQASSVIASILASDTSQGTPTCSSSQCVCSSGHTVMTALDPRVGCTDICVSNTTTLDQAIGANCTSFNQCGAEGICLQCPGDVGGKCYASPCAPGGGAGMHVAKGATLVLLVHLLAFFY